MAHWYYKGKTPTPIDHPEKGPIVLTSRMRFYAPHSAVSHLKDLVVRIGEDPKKPEVPVVFSPTEEVGRSQTEATETATEAEVLVETAPSHENVVASESSTSAEVPPGDSPGTQKKRSRRVRAESLVEEAVESSEGGEATD